MAAFLDPNTWVFEAREYRIYADDYANDYAVVDQIDYQYLIQWRWKLKQSRIHKGTKKPKAYLCRAAPEIIGPDSYEGGKRRQQRIVRSVYLHHMVAERAKLPKPSTNKRLVLDHADGDELNCRRLNLRWTTISFNNKNRFGSHAAYEMI